MWSLFLRLRDVLRSSSPDLELFVRLVDAEEVEHDEFQPKFASDATLGELEAKIYLEFGIRSEYQQLSIENGEKIRRLRSEKLASIGLKAGDTIIVKHALLQKWVLYRKSVEQLLSSNEKAPNRKALMKMARNLYVDLNRSDFFKAYAKFGDFEVQNHWQIVRCLDGESNVIAAAAREYFSLLNALKGGSTFNFCLKWKPKKGIGSRCGIICDVTFKNEETTTFQVKTHHFGGSSFANRASGPDIRELFCYKLLELIGVGPEMHFVLPSKDLGSKTAVYIATKWRTDFLHLAPEKDKTTVDDMSGEALVQLRLLQIILGLEDLHGGNCGQWKGTKDAAIVDFFVGAAEGVVSEKLFLERFKTRLAWDDYAKELFASIPRADFMAWAKNWLETWNFMSNVEKAYNKVGDAKNALVKENRTKFRGFTDEDGYCVSKRITDDLLEYVEWVKKNATTFLQ